MKSYIAVDWGSTQLRGLAGSRRKMRGDNAASSRVSAAQRTIAGLEVFHRYLTPWRSHGATGSHGRNDRQAMRAGRRCPTRHCPAAIDEPGVSCLPLLTACGLFPALR